MLFIIGFVSTTLWQVVNGKDNVTACYAADTREYCFYMDGTKLRWNEATEFCERRNSTLPIIKDEDTDNVFQQFIANDSMIQITDVINFYYLPPPHLLTAGIVLGTIHIGLSVCTSVGPSPQNCLIYFK